MKKDWSINGKQGRIWWPEGEVVYQTPVKGTVVVEPIYEDYDGRRYILDNEELLEVTSNPFNGYCYRQDRR